MLPALLQPLHGLQALRVTKGENKACCLRYCNRFTGCKHCG